MERRQYERKVASLPVTVTAEQRSWRGTCINLSEEGALLKLDSLWTGASEIVFQIDHQPPAEGFSATAHVVRASSPDHIGSFLAIRFLESMSHSRDA